MNLDLDEIGLSVLYYMFGSHCLIMFGGTPANVPYGLIHAIRQRVDEINVVGGELFDILRPGDSVMIHSGPFAGYEAIFDTACPVRNCAHLLETAPQPADAVELPTEQIKQKTTFLITPEKECRFVVVIPG